MIKFAQTVHFKFPVKERWHERKVSLITSVFTFALCWESKVYFCLTFNTFIIQFLIWNYILRTFVSAVKRQENSRMLETQKRTLVASKNILFFIFFFSLCRMFETQRRTLVASKNILLWIFYFLLCSTADAQQSRMNSGIFKKVIFNLNRMFLI